MTRLVNLSSTASVPPRLLERRQVALGVHPVVPLLVEDRQEAVAHREGGAFGWPARPHARVGLAAQLGLVETLHHAAYQSHRVLPDRQRPVERRPGVAVLGNAQVAI